MLFLTYETSKLLGWATALLALSATSYHIAIKLNIILVKRNTNNSVIVLLKKLLKTYVPFIHAYHKPIGTMAIVTGLIHGYSLLQTIEFHSGYILWSFIIFLGLSGLLMKVFKMHYKPIKSLHRFLMYVTIILMLFHVITMQ